MPCMNYNQPDNPGGSSGHHAESASHNAANPAGVEKSLERLAQRATALGNACSNERNTQLHAALERLTDAIEQRPGPDLTEVASELESVLLSEEAEMTALHEQIEDLISFCRRVASTKKNE